MDVKSAIEFMRAQNAPLYGAWQVCEAAGMDSKRQARLFTNPEVVAFMRERGLLYGPQARTEGGKWFGVVFTKGHFNPTRTARAERDYERLIAQSLERARASRREYRARKRLEKKAGGGSYALDTTSLPPPPQHPASPRLTAALSAIGGGDDANNIALLPPPDLDAAQAQWEQDCKDRDAQWAASLPETLPLALRTRSAWNKAKRKAGRDASNTQWSAQMQQEADKRERDERNLAWYKANAKRDKFAMQAGYAAGLVTRLDPPDPNQLSLLDLIAA
jgi:hypothetical protein